LRFKFSLASLRLGGEKQKIPISMLAVEGRGCHHIFMIEHKARPKNSVIAAIDIGSSKVACLIAHVIDDKGTAEVIGFGHIASKGVKAGIIVDLKETIQSAKEAVNAAENMAAKTMGGFPLRDVVMSIPSTYTHSHRAAASVNIGGANIQYKHI
jgi:cell division protein FtsA